MYFSLQSETRKMHCFAFFRKFPFLLQKLQKIFWRRQFLKKLNIYPCRFNIMYNFKKFFICVHLWVLKVMHYFSVCLRFVFVAKLHLFLSLMSLYKFMFIKFVLVLITCISSFFLCLLYINRKNLLHNDNNFSYSVKHHEMQKTN